MDDRDRGALDPPERGELAVIDGAVQFMEGLRVAFRDHVA